MLESEIQESVYTQFRGGGKGRGREKKVLIPKREYILELQ